MKKIFFLVGVFLLSAWVLRAQEKEEGFQFKELKRLPATCVKSQDRAGTCWAWSTVSFFESEVMRLGKDSVSLAPMFVVRNTYTKKGDKYVRLHGYLNFGEGGSAVDVQWVMKHSGIVPLDVYPGLEYGEKQHVHGEMNGILKNYVDAVVKDENRKITPVWNNGYEKVLDAYLGKKPESFVRNGKSYTPQSYLKELGLNMDDYVCLTSLTNEPYYAPHIFESPDNWLWGQVYNLPLDEFITVLDGAIDKGYSFGWSADVSEKGFGRKGVATVPVTDVKEMAGSDMARWLSLSPKERESELYDKPGKEKLITPEMRQEAFDNYQTTDDHAMHIVGKAVDQAGNKYFIVKNSWGKYGPYDGYFYASYPYVAYKTTTVIVNKHALPDALRAKMGI